MIEEFAGEELEHFRFPQLYVDHVSRRLAASIDAPEIFGKRQKDELQKTAVQARAIPFWREIQEYNARLGASKISMDNVGALSEGRAVPVVTGQQPGLFGGPLYTLYKLLTAAALCGELSRSEASGTAASERGGGQVVPVLWNASDDSDFAEVSSATFFGKDLSLERFSVAGTYHHSGNMVGSTSAEALGRPIETLMHDLERSPGTDLVLACIEDGLSVAGDWGEFFSALFLRLLSSSGVVVVDARLPSVARHSAQITGEYLREASLVEARVTECLEGLKKQGYGAPVSPRSGETCVFIKDGMARKKVSKDELPAIADLWRKGEIELLPNVLLGPVVRDELMGPVANVVGPSESSYYVVARVVYGVLGLAQRPVFPRLSATVVPRAVASLACGERGRLKDLVISFEKVARGHFESHIPSEVRRELEVCEGEIRSAIERMVRTAGLSDKGTEEIAVSAERKIEFELGRVREAFVAAYRKRVLSENPMLRKAGEFLLPRGTLQERTLCSLAPLVYGGEPFMKAVNELARNHVLETLEGRVRHYVASVAIP